MLARLTAGPSTAPDGLDVVDWTTLAVDWIPFLVEPSPSVDGFEVDPPVLHNSPWQQSIVQLETSPPSLSILHELKSDWGSQAALTEQFLSSTNCGAPMPIDMSYFIFIHLS